VIGLLRLDLFNRNVLLLKLFGHVNRQSIHLLTEFLVVELGLL
jgi:hypothetical protein